MRITPMRSADAPVLRSHGVIISIEIPDITLSSFPAKTCILLDD
jgi:hypothetical protein